MWAGLAGWRSVLKVRKVRPGGIFSDVYNIKCSFFSNIFPDPHVRIVGQIEQVQRAKDNILSTLDSRVSLGSDDKLRWYNCSLLAHTLQGTRVIMKMDVSYTDHSYIIGRGGNNIKRIMDDTHTHIHFPDSNRSNPTEKSNQVSLCGSLEGVERARALVRLSTPLLISFEMPVMGPGKAQPDHETPYIKMIESKFNVQVKKYNLLVPLNRLQLITFRSYFLHVLSYIHLWCLLKVPKRSRRRCAMLHNC